MADEALTSDQKQMIIQTLALEACRERFQEYADLHRAKMTPDGDAKARRNEAMVIMIETVLEISERLKAQLFEG